MACVVGDGEAETGPLATGWHGNKFLHPARDGAVLPDLHLNGSKIASPTALARIPEAELRELLEGCGYAPRLVTGDDPKAVHRQMPVALDACEADIHTVQADARTNGFRGRPTWPMVVLRTPRGWTCPHEIDGQVVEGSWRSHQVSMADGQSAAHVRLLEGWLRSYRPEELSAAAGRLAPQLAALAAAGDRRMGANPHANGGALLSDLELPDFRTYAVAVPAPGAAAEATKVQGAFLRDELRLNDGRRTSGYSARASARPTAGRTCSRPPAGASSGRPAPATTPTCRRPAE